MDRERDARRETHYTPESLRQWRLARQQRLQSQARAADVDTPRQDAPRPPPPTYWAAAPYTDSQHTESETHETLFRRERWANHDAGHSHSPYAHAATHRRVSDYENSRLNNVLEEHRPSPHGLRSPVAHKSPRLLLPSLPFPSSSSSFSAEAEGSPSPASLRLQPIAPAQVATPSEQRDSSETELPSEAAATASEPAVSCRVGWCAAPAKRYGLCWTHGGEKRCCRSGCARAATASSEFCELHELQQRR